MDVGGPSTLVQSDCELGKEPDQRLSLRKDPLPTLEPKPPCDPIPPDDRVLQPGADDRVLQPGTDDRVLQPGTVSKVKKKNSTSSKANYEGALLIKRKI
jgi:hypothetical protein